MLLLCGIALTLPFVQTKLGSYATDFLKKEFGVDIQVERVSITPFGTVKLNNVFIRDHHNDTLAHIKRVNTSILSFSDLVEKGHPFFGELQADELNFKIINYKGEKDTNLDVFVAAFDEKPPKPSSGRFRLKANSILLKNSRFRYIDYNKEKSKFIDFTNLNGQLDDFFIKGPNVYAYAYELSFKDHRGLIVKNLTTDFTYTKKNILLNELVLETEKSKFKGKTELRYNRKDFKDFNNKVIFDVDIKEGEFSSDDLNYFYPEFSKKQKFFIDSHIVGTLNNLNFNHLKLEDTNGNAITGKINFKNLFGKGNQKFYMKGQLDKFIASKKSLSNILPQLLGKHLPNELDRFGNVDLTGLVELTENWLKADVDVYTKLGHVVADFDLDGLQEIAKAKYKGDFILDKFQLGAITKENLLGSTSGNFYIDGKGFTPKYINTFMDGNLENFYFKGYNYKNINVKGNLKMPYFKGYFKSNDANLKMTFDGLVDMSGRKKIYDFEANIDYANLKKTNLYTRDQKSILKGDVSIDLVGNTIDDLVGEIQLKNVAYSNQKNDYSFEDATITSNFDGNNVRTITANSEDLLEGKITGKFKINQLKKIAENAAGSLYANYSPHKLSKGQYVDFDIKVYNKILEVLYPDVTIAENTHAKGSMHGDDGLFQLDFTSNLVTYLDKSAHNIKVDIDNKNPLYNVYLEVDSLVHPKYKISDFSLINITHEDTLFVRTEFKGGKKGEDKFDLNLFHTINENKQSIVGFKKSDITFKNYQWYINEKEEKNNIIAFDKKFKNFEFDQLKLSHNEQFIDLNGVIKENNYKDLTLTFNDVEISKITPELTNVTFAGLLNGNLNYKQDRNVYEPTSDLNIKDFVWNDIDLGDLELNVTGDETFKKFNVNASLLHDDLEKFLTTGTIDFFGKDPNLNLEVNLQNFNIAPIGGFMKDIVKNVRGEALGRVAIQGNIYDPEIDGILYLNNAGLKIPYTNVDYNFDKNSIINITEEKFIFRSIEFSDVNEATKGVLSGNITHKKLEDWKINLRIDTNRLLVNDTKDSEDAYYFGKAYLDGYGIIKGPVNALVIEAEGKSAKGTSLKIPVNDSESVSDNGLVHIVTREEKYKTQKIVKTKAYKGIDLNFYFVINRDAEIEVILNRETGHSMKGIGEGTLSMLFNTLGKFEMYGDYQVIEGKYLFKYGTIIDKKFDVKPGGTIRWDGDPMGAILNLEATYNTQASLNVLLENNSLNKKYPTEVGILITGDLNKPESDFTINFPNIQSVLKSEIDYRLQDKDFRQRQAFGLLATGNFIAPDNMAWYGSFLETASSIFGEVLSDGENKINIVPTYQIGDRQRDISDRALVTLSTQINDKISVNGNVGVPVGGVTQSYIVGNVEVEMKLNTDGTLTAHVFNKENVNNLTIGQNIGYTQGVGLAYSVDFDDFKELFNKLFRKNKSNNSSDNQSDNQDSELSPEIINFIEEAKKRQLQNQKTNNERVIVPDLED